MLRSVVSLSIVLDFRMMVGELTNTMEEHIVVRYRSRLLPCQVHPADVAHRRVFSGSKLVTPNSAEGFL